MAYWHVTEPIPNVWLRDRPLWYQPSRGGKIEFTLTYKGRLGANGALDNSETNMFSVGTNWFTPWRSYLEPAVNGGATNFFVSLGDGTLLSLMTNMHARGSGMRLTTAGTNYVVEFPSGKKQIYGTPFTFGSNTRYLLSAMVDAQSNRLDFLYATSNSLAKLIRIDDFDGNQITFEYTNSTRYPALISKIVGPFNLTNYLAYNTNGQLTQIKDVVGLPSDMQYDSSNRVSHLITPYGTNTFSYLLSTNGAWQGIRVNELDLRKHFYLYGAGPTNVLPGALKDYDSLSQLVTSAGMSELFTTNNLHDRNSYYWGPRQYVNLPASVRTNVDNGTFDISLLTTNNYNIGRLRHWLTRGNSSTNFTMNSLALERAPSPDSAGNSEGLMTWYDYQDKLNNDRNKEGMTHQQPKFIAYKVGTAGSGGTTKTNWNVKYADYNNWGLATTRKETYGEPTTGTQLWRTNVYAYAANGTDLLTVTENGVVESSMGYNTTHQMTGSTNALNEATTYAYTANLQIDTITHPNDLVVDYSYDGAGRLASIVDRDGLGTGYRTNSYTYANGLIQTQTDERGLKITNTWDALGRLRKITYPDGTYVTNTYDKLHLVRVLDRMGFTNGYAYNGFRQVTRITNSNHKVTTNEYCDCGSLSSVTDPLGNATTYLYDNAGRQTRVTLPGGSYTDLFYDIANRVNRTTDSAGVSVTNAYTVNGLLYTATNAFGRMFYRSYDAEGHLRVSIDNNGMTNGYAYDDLDRLRHSTNSVLETFPGEYESVEDAYEYTLNIAGVTATYRQFVQNMGTFTTNYTQLSEKVEYRYDLFGRKTNEVHKNTSGTAILTNRFRYDLSGNLTNLIDGKAQNTYWKYDQYGRVTNKVDHAGSDMFRYLYDASGRLTSCWTPEKGTTSYSYDNVGNLTFINFPASTDITLGYDANNRLTNMIDAVGTTRFTYAAFGALLSEDGPWENDTVSYTYDNGRRRSGLSVQAPNASPWSQSYTFDAASRLSTLTSPAGTFNYGYHAGLSGSSPADLVKSITLPNTSAITNNYDSRGRMLGTWLRKNNGTLLNKHEYVLNDLEQRTKQTRTAGDYIDYAYDPLGQLTDAVATESGGVTNRWQEQFAYAYDAAGNLTNRIQHRLTNGFTVNSLNQLTGGSRGGRMSIGGTTTGPATNVMVNASNAVLYLDYTFASTNHSLADGTNTFTAIGKDNLGRIDTNTSISYLPSSPIFAYDSNGNLTNDGQRVFGYDDENQLTNVTVAGQWKSDFTYDGLMSRRIRREYTWENSAWVLANEVRYLYDENRVVQERNSLHPLVTYTRGDDLSGSLGEAGGIGGLLARTDHVSVTPDHSFYHADAVGNISSLVNWNQQTVAKYVYDPFGNIIAKSGILADANVYRFSSKEAHPNSGLVYYLYRYCDPAIGKWLTRDPIGETGDINLYRFIGNSPINNIDPEGEFLFKLVACVLVAIIVYDQITHKPSPHIEPSPTKTPPPPQVQPPPGTPPVNPPPPSGPPGGPPPRPPERPRFHRSGTRGKDVPPPIFWVIAAWPVLLASRNWLALRHRAGKTFERR